MATQRTIKLKKSEALELKEKIEPEEPVEQQPVAKEKRGIRLPGVVLPGLSIPAKEKEDKDKLPDSSPPVAIAQAIPKLSRYIPEKTEAEEKIGKLNLPMDVGPSPLIDGMQTTRKSESTKGSSSEGNGTDALIQLATSTIVKVQRLELDVEQIKSRIEEIGERLQSTIDYINAMALQMQTLGSQNMYMAWQSRLLEFNLAALAGVGMSVELIDQAKFEVNKWSQDASVKQRQAEEAFSKIVK